MDSCLPFSGENSNTVSVSVATLTSAEVYYCSSLLLQERGLVINLLSQNLKCLLKLFYDESYFVYLSIIIIIHIVN